MLFLLLILFVGLEIGMPAWFWALYGFTASVELIAIICRIITKINDIMED